MARNTPMGQKFYLIDRNWDQYEYDYKEYRKAMRAKRRERVEAMLAEMIANGTKHEQRPTKDLF